MRIFRAVAALTVFIIGILLWLLIPSIGNQEQDHMQKQFTDSIISEELPENYSIYLDIKRRYFVHIVSDERKMYINAVPEKIGF